MSGTAYRPYALNLTIINSFLLYLIDEKKKTTKSHAFIHTRHSIKFDESFLLVFLIIHVCMATKQALPALLEKRLIRFYTSRRKTTTKDKKKYVVVSINHGQIYRKGI